MDYSCVHLLGLVLTVKLKMYCSTACIFIWWLYDARLRLLLGHNAIEFKSHEYGVHVGQAKVNYHRGIEKHATQYNVANTRLSHS